MFRANFCPSSGAQDWDFFTAYGIVSCSCGRQGFGARQRGTTCTVWRKLLVVPRCRAPNPCLPQQQDTIPYAVKKSQSCAPKDGQKFARNMLSWSWRSIKLLLLHLVGFLYYFTCITLFSKTSLGKLLVAELDKKFPACMSPKIFFACSKTVLHSPLTVSIHVLGRNFLSNWPSLMKDGTKDKPMDFITLSHGSSLIMCHEE